jgi:hypothetical protein
MAEDPENNDNAAANSTVVVCQNLNQYLISARYMAIIGA